MKKYDIGGTDMSEFIIEMDNWDRQGKRYVYPGTVEGNNWQDVGLVPRNKYTADLFGWYGFSFETEVHGKAEIEIKVGLLDFGEINAEEIIDYYTWKAAICGDGIVKIVAPLGQFDLLSSMPAKWKFMRSIEINREVKNLKALKGKGVYAHAHVLSKSAEPGETIRYKLQIVNCLDIKQAITFNFEKTGYEVLSPYITTDEVILSPFEEKICYMKVQMSDKIVEGGFEKHCIHVLPNGDGSKGQTLEFYSVRHMKHPYISGTESKWDEVKDKIQKYEWAKNIADTYIKRAEEWQVPDIGDVNHGMFETVNAHKCFNCAIAWKLTGRREFAEKSADFLRLVADKKSGYPARLKACSQQLVHEGEFFKSCAKAYDLIHDTGVISSSGHQDIHNTFRLFIDFLDWSLADGGISNWSLAEIAGALYCAMALQDREKIERFVFGTGGAMDHLRAGVYSDGWWCECTIGYNQMVAGLFSEYTLALRPWGINIANWWVPAQYSNKVHFRNKHADGLSWDIFGPNTRNYRCIEDLWDSLVAMANYRSVVQGVNDSAEEKFMGADPVAFDSRYDIAYAIYKKPEYAAIINNAGEGAFRDLINGVGELPKVKIDSYRKSYHFDNGGIALLRTNTAGRSDEEQFEISLKYGSHGGAHGHYDRCALNAVSRYGKALFNPENVWYSYGTFMYKFYVQNSITHNMVTVDLKLQDPSESRLVLFGSNELFGAACVENQAVWSNPPYGGWRVMNNETTFENRTWVEGRYVPIPENPPPYTKRTDFTEPVMQRRLTVLTDDYVVCFDYIRGGIEHDYHCIYHLPGLKSIDNDTLELVGHYDKLTEDPLSSAQFITEVDHYRESGVTRLSFEYEYDEAHSAKAQWIPAAFRSGHNVPGVLKTDLYFVQGTPNELFVGCDPEYQLTSKRLFWAVEADGETIAEGKFGSWMFGRDHIDEDISGRAKLRLRVRTEDGMNDHALVRDTVRSIFWGDPRFVTEDGSEIYLADMSYETDNVDNGNGPGVDYAGGPVKIEQKEYKKAVPGDVLDKSGEAVITIDLNGIKAVRFISDIGGDYPVGDESGRRRFAAQYKHERSARFISILEPYTDKRMIKDIKFDNYNRITVELNDGRTQVITVSELDGDGEDISAAVEEYRDGRQIRRAEEDSVK